MYEENAPKSKNDYIQTVFVTVSIFLLFFIGVHIYTRSRKLMKEFSRCGFGLFFGSPADVLQKILEYLQIYDTTPCNFWLGFTRYVVVAKPDDLQVVLNNQNTMEKSCMYKFFVNTVGEGLFSAPAEKWRKHRRIIAPSFNTRLLDNFFPIFNRKNDKLLMNFRNEADTGYSFDLWKYISSTALEIVCETIMGFDLNNEEYTKAQFEQALMRASEADSMRIYKPWLHPNIVFNIYTFFTGLNKSYRMIHELPLQIIQQKKKEIKQNKYENVGSDEFLKNKFTSTFLDTLLLLNENGARFTDNDIRDEVVTMMIGGSETSALTISYTLLMLAMHPDIQEKVREEINGIVGDEKFVVLENVQKMTYLEQCIKETLRLFPVGPLFLRRATAVIKLGSGFTVPAGSNIIIPPIKVHRDPKIYRNPMIWNPDNFTKDEIEKRHRYSFLAFSGGPRGCIGSKYAMFSMKVTISKIIQNFYITTDVNFEDIKLKIDLLMRSVYGYKIKLYSRKTK